MRAPLLLVLATVFGTSPARANMAAPLVIPGYTAHPAAATRIALAVVREELRLGCAAGPGGPACDLDARYVIANPTAEPITTPVVFLTFRAEGLVATVDGERAPTDLSPTERLALDATVAALSAGPLGSADAAGEPPARLDLRIVVAPASQRLIRVRGRIPLGRTVARGYDLLAAEAVTARHLALGGRARGDRLHLDYLLAPINSWAGIGEVQVIVEHPPGWRFAGDGPAWETAHRGDVDVETSVSAGPQPERLRISFFVPPPAVENGGVLLGLGARLDGERGVRLRVGYELAWRKSRLLSLTVDTDVERELVVTPTMELALPAVLVIPSLGLGLGAPVVLRPDVELGLRGQLSAMLYPIGAVLAVDLFPAAADRVRVTLLGQVGF